MHTLTGLLGYYLHTRFVALFISQNFINRNFLFGVWELMTRGRGEKWAPWLMTGKHCYCMNYACLASVCTLCSQVWKQTDTFSAFCGTLNVLLAKLSLCLLLCRTVSYFFSCKTGSLFKEKGVIVCSRWTVYYCQPMWTCFEPLQCWCCHLVL